jgi:hypothetical protein
MLYWIMKLSEIIGSTSAISHRKAALAYEYIASNLSVPTTIEISFSDMEDFSSAFVNAWLGQLYMAYDPTILNAKILFTDLPTNNIWLTKIERAILLGSNKAFRENHQATLSDLIA